MSRVSGLSRVAQSDSAVAGASSLPLVCPERVPWAPRGRRDAAGRAVAPRRLDESLAWLCRRDPSQIPDAAPAADARLDLFAARSRAAPTPSSTTARSRCAPRSMRDRPPGVADPQRAAAGSSTWASVPAAARRRRADRHPGHGLTGAGDRRPADCLRRSAAPSPSRRGPSTRGSNRLAGQAPALASPPATTEARAATAGRTLG